MKNTRIVRRTNAFGCIGIPKIVRQKFNIKEGDLFEVAFEENGTICFIPIQEEE